MRSHPRARRVARHLTTAACLLLAAAFVFSLRWYVHYMHGSRRFCFGISTGRLVTGFTSSPQSNAWPSGRGWVLGDYIPLGTTWVAPGLRPYTGTNPPGIYWIDLPLWIPFAL